MGLAKGRGAVLVAVDSDPNEDAALIARTWKERGLTEPVAITPQAMSEQLVQQFGPQIVTPPTAPIVLINADQTSAVLLTSGLKSAEELQAAIEKAK